MSGWQSSSEDWKTHPRSYWNDVLEVARSRGWYFRAGSSHIFGKIACKAPPNAHDPGDVCAERIFTSGGGNPEKVAKDVAKMIRACKHVDDDPSDASDDVRAERLLREANILLDGAAKLIEAEKERANCQTLINTALEQADHAERLMDGAGEAEGRALLAEAYGKATVARVSAVPLSAAGAVGAGEEKVDEAGAVGSSTLAAAVDSARRRAAGLRQLLGSF